MRLLILWTGIAAFVLIGFRPVEGWWGWWIIELLRNWAVVVVLTGGLLWSEPRLTPWLRRHRRVVSGTILGVLLLCLTALLSCVAWSVWASQIQGVTFVTGRQENTALVLNVTPEQARAELRRRGAIRLSDIPDTSRPDDGREDIFDRISPTGPTANRTYTTAEVEIERQVAIRQEIDNFFGADGMDVYGDFYGKAGDWQQLTPGQRANRIEVCNRAQAILDGAAFSGMKLNTAEALERAHLEVIAPLAEQFARERIVSSVRKWAVGAIAVVLCIVVVVVVSLLVWRRKAGRLLIGHPGFSPGGNGADPAPAARSYESAPVEIGQLVEPR